MARRQIVNGWIYEVGDDGRLRPVGPASGPKAPADPNDASGIVVNYRPQAVLTPEARARAMAQWQASLDLDPIIADLHRQYVRGPGSTQGLAGIADYLPLSANREFDRTADAARIFARNALSLTGGGNNPSPSDVDPYIPTAGQRDGDVVGGIERLQGLRDDTRRRAIDTLGGIPDADGNITPVPPITPWDQVYLSHGDPPRAAGFGAKTTSWPIPPAMQQEYDDYIARHIGNLDPDDYLAFRRGLDKKYGFDEADEAKQAAYCAEAVRIGETGRQGGTVMTASPGLRGSFRSGRRRGTTPSATR